MRELLVLRPTVLHMHLIRMHRLQPRLLPLRNHLQTLHQFPPTVPNLHQRLMRHMRLPIPTQPHTIMRQLHQLPPTVPDMQRDDVSHMCCRVLPERGSVSAMYQLPRTMPTMQPHRMHTMRHAIHRQRYGSMRELHRLPCTVCHLHGYDMQHVQHHSLRYRHHMLTMHHLPRTMPPMHPNRMHTMRRGVPGQRQWQVYAMCRLPRTMRHVLRLHMHHMRHSFLPQRDVMRQLPELPHTMLTMYLITMHPLQHGFQSQRCGWLCDV